MCRLQVYLHGKRQRTKVSGWVGAWADGDLLSELEHLGTYMKYSIF